VAGGTLVLIFGVSALSYGYGPGWFALLLTIVGAVVMVIGRLMRTR